MEFFYFVLYEHFKIYLKNPAGFTVFFCCHFRIEFGIDVFFVLFNTFQTLKFLFFLLKKFCSFCATLFLLLKVYDLIHAELLVYGG